MHENVATLSINGTTLKFTKGSILKTIYVLSDPGIRDCPRGTLLLGYRMGHDPRPTSVVTTRNAVGLLVQ
jgi:hypothetical protein